MGLISGQYCVMNEREVAEGDIAVIIVTESWERIVKPMTSLISPAGL